MSNARRLIATFVALACLTPHETRAEDPFELMRKIQNLVEIYVKDRSDIETVQVLLEPRADDEMEALAVKSVLENAAERHRLIAATSAGSGVAAAAAVHVLQKSGSFSADWERADGQLVDAFRLRMTKEYARNPLVRAAATEKLEKILTVYPTFRYLLEPDVWLGDLARDSSLNVTVDPETRIYMTRVQLSDTFNTNLPIFMHDRVKRTVIREAWIDLLETALLRWGEGTKPEDIPFLSFGKTDLKQFFTDVRRLSPDGCLYVKIEGSRFESWIRSSLPHSDAEGYVRLPDLIQHLQTSNLMAIEQTEATRRSVGLMLDLFPRIERASQAGRVPEFGLVHTESEIPLSATEASVIEDAKSRVLVRAQDSYTALLNDRADLAVSIAKERFVTFEKSPKLLRQEVHPIRSLLARNLPVEVGSLVAIAGFIFLERVNRDRVEEELCTGSAAILRCDALTLAGDLLRKAAFEADRSCHPKAPCVLRLPISETALSVAARVRTNKGITELR